MPTYRPPTHQVLDDDGRATFVSHFLASHRAFRRDAARFPVALRRIGTERAPDTDALCRHWAGYNAALAYHHHLEDQQIFPALRSIDPALGDVIDTLLAQHDDLDRTIGDVEERLNLLPAPEAAGPAALACEDLAAALDVHFDLEEAHLVPVLRASGFEPAHGEPGKAQEAPPRPPDQDPQAFVMPWVADSLDDVTVAALHDAGPPSMKASFAGWNAEYCDRLRRWWR